VELALAPSTPNVVYVSIQDADDGAGHDNGLLGLFKSINAPAPEVCPVCGKGTCIEHRAVCSHCGRQVCMADLQQESGHCATCAQLATTPEPPLEAVTAARVVTGRAPRSSRWRVARDRTHLVVELDLGFRRKAVVTMRHGGDAPESVVQHSLLGSKRRK